MGLRITGIRGYGQSGSVAWGMAAVRAVASEVVFAACPVSGTAVSVRFFVRLRLVIGFDRHKIRLDREVIQGDVVHADVSN